MLKRIFPALALTSGLALAAGLLFSQPAVADHRHATQAARSDASAHHRNAPQIARHRERRESRHHNHGGRAERLEVSLQRRVRDSVLPLRRMLGLGPTYRGYRVESVLIELKPQSRRTRLHLLTNDRIADRQTARRDRFVELVPGRDRTLGYDLDTLKLAVHGKAFIRDITVTLVPQPRRAQRRQHHWHAADDAWRLILNGPLFQRRY